MPIAIPSRFKSRLEKFIKELNAYALLPPEEPVNEGFYTLFAEKVLYYGLLTENHLILIHKKLRKLDKSEIIPFKKIEEISFFKERRTRDLISIFVLLGMLPLIYFLFWMIGDPSVPSSFSTGLQIFLWFFVALLIFGVISNTYIYLRGVGRIKLVIPDKTIKLQCLYTWTLGFRDIILFNIHEGTLEEVGLKMKVEELYHHLNKYVES